MVIISIEGNIGVGKTTLINQLEVIFKDRNPTIILEPIDEWQQWLHDMYTDPKRWSFFFNLKVLLTLSSWFPRGQPAASPGDITITERSPLACRYVFSRVQHERQEMTDKELTLLDEAHDALGWEPDVVIYLRDEPCRCVERMRQRGRSSEEGVNLDYVEGVHAKYEELFKAAFKKKVIIVDVAHRTPIEIAQDVSDKIIAEGL